MEPSGLMAEERRELLALLEAKEAKAAEREAEARRRELMHSAEQVRARCQSLAGFVREAWHVLEPNARLVWNWHLDALCEHLEAVTDGRITRLLVNVPPGSSKSLIVSVLWQAWEWGPRGLASLRYLTTSFNEGPVKRDTRKTRDLMLSHWFKALWPEIVLSRTGETSFANTATGTREGVAFGSLTSQRGDRLIIDDPHSTETAESDADRTATTRKFREGATNRLNDQERSAIVVIMQRLHEQDLSGVIQKLGMGYVHVCLPMEFEPARRCETLIGFKDPRQEEGELLDPVRFPRSAVDALKRDMGSYAYAGQYQQRPAPRDGGMFKRHWFGITPAVPANSSRVRKWDLAATAETGGRDPDWTVGLLMARDISGFVYVEDVIRFRGSSADVERAIVNTAALDADRYGIVRIGLNQDPGQAGKAQIGYLTRALMGFNVESERETGTKEVRAAPLAAQAEAGNVKIVTAPWNEAFLSELENFPTGSHDDQVDAASGAFAMLATASLAAWAKLAG